MVKFLDWLQKNELFLKKCNEKIGIDQNDALTQQMFVSAVMIHSIERINV